MSMFQFLGDAVRGTMEQTNKIREENLAQQQRDDQIHQRVLETLANSDDLDPEIRSAAVTSMLMPRPKQSGFAKWFREVQPHPGMSIVSSLMGAREKPAYLTPEQKAEQTTSGQRRGSIQGAMSGFGQGMVDAGYGWPSQEDMTAVGRGAAGAPTRAQRFETMQGYTSDGEPVAGVMREDGFYDLAGNPRPDVVRWEKGGARPAGGAGATGVKRTERMPAQVWNQNYGAQYGMAPAGAQYVSASFVNGVPQGPAMPALYSPPPVFTGSPIPLADGSVAAFTRGGGIVQRELPGSRGSTPESNATNARAVLEQVRRDADGSVPKFGGIVNQQRLQAARDQAAVKYGYQNYSDLQRRAGEAVQGIESSTPPPPDRPMGIDVDKVLNYLQQRQQQR
jgi:hypothetical protein